MHACHWCATHPFYPLLPLHTPLIPLHTPLHSTFNNLFMSLQLHGGLTSLSCPPAYLLAQATSAVPDCAAFNLGEFPRHCRACFFHFQPHLAFVVLSMSVLLGQTAISDFQHGCLTHPHPTMLMQCGWLIKMLDIPHAHTRL